MFYRLLSIYNKLFVVWIILGGVVAYLRPEYLITLKPYMDYFFAFTMFGVGMVLNPKDFQNIFKHFWVILIGVVAQFTIMPFSGLIVSKIFALSDEFTLGLILTGSAPGAMASNVLSYLAGADVAYSVSLTAVSTFLSPLMTPSLTHFLADTILEVPFWNMFFSVIKMVIVPLLLGIGIKKIFHKKIENIIEIFPAFSTTFIVFICSLVIALNVDYIAQLEMKLFFAVVLLNLFGIFAGYGVGKLFNFDLLKKRALSIEIGMQNAGLGSVLALKHFNEKVALPAVIFVFICIFSTSFLAQIWGRKTNIE